MPHKKFSLLFFTAYIGVVYLPQGSSSILVEEMTVAPNNYLALRNMKGHYYLNGGWRLDSEGVYPIAGTKFIYRRPYNRAEMISAEGPLLEDLVLEVSWKWGGSQFLAFNCLETKCFISLKFNCFRGIFIQFLNYMKLKKNKKKSVM